VTHAQVQAAGTPALVGLSDQQNALLRRACTGGRGDLAARLRFLRSADTERDRLIDVETVRSWLFAMSHTHWEPVRFGSIH
jgi:hypothetical protein